MIPRPVPTKRPTRPYFSSGPCVKHKNWAPSIFDTAIVHRSHRSTDGVSLLRQAIHLTRDYLNIPKDYRIAIMAGSDMGVMGACMWNLLGDRPVDIFAWDVFGRMWVDDVLHRLCLPNATAYVAPYGTLPNLKDTQADHDTLFTWNGTTAGLWVPNGDWISDNRSGLTICDAVSAVFCVDLPWEKLDVTTFSWQKGIGSEAAHGMAVLSPRAIDRLMTYQPPWPIPRIFDFKKDDTLNHFLFDGYTINTPSLLCVHDYIDALDWVGSQGGLQTMIKRANHNRSLIIAWVHQTPWARFVAQDDQLVSVSPCIELLDSQGDPCGWDMIVSFCRLLEEAGAAYDIKGHQDAVPCIRLWIGPTTEEEDIMDVLPWLEWAYDMVVPDRTAHSNVSMPSKVAIK